VLTGAFFHAGTWSSFRHRVHGRPVDRTRIPGYRFVAYLQNHDQIGNRARGDRLTATLSASLMRVGAMLLFTAPFTPMLFMGEEWAATTPWQFFTSHPEPELAAAVACGRTAEFAAHGWPEGDVPDPQDPQTYLRSRLDWDEPGKPDHAEMLAFYKRLIALRREHADLSDPRLDKVDVAYGDRWIAVRRGGTAVAANLADGPQRVALPGEVGSVLLATEDGATVERDGVRLPPESAIVAAIS
jgi:maltooligosyltrehalose trehalohydrolase